MIAGAGVAFADNALPDGDAVVVGRQTSVTLGQIPCNTATVQTVGVAANRNSTVVNNNTWANSAVLTASGTVTPTSGPVAVGAPTGTVTLPSNWTTIGNNAVSNYAVLPITVTPTASTTTGLATLSLSLTGAGAQTASVTKSASIDVTWSTDCPPPPPANTAPSAPGAPQALATQYRPATPNQGGFTLAWTASADNENNAFTYTLEGKNSAANADWQELASGLTSPSYTFPAGGPTEGTWMFRVKAVETSTSPALSSGYSGTSAPVVVDRTGPNTPTAHTDPTAEYTAPDGTSWWKDNVTVSFTDNGDPVLTDGSAGSGVTSVSGPQEFNTQGSFTAYGFAQDAAGNYSAGARTDGSVDTEAPVLNAICPAGPFVLGSTQSVAWSATDTGGSGIHGDASGTLPVDTSTVGTHAFTVPTVTDNVGHESNTVTCSTYSVVYAWTGFFSPVSMSKVNSVKAGSAVPIKFSLSGNQGLDIITSATVTPKGGTIFGAEEVPTLFAGQSSLQYDPTTDQYTYVWKTDKSWAGTSGTFTLTLNDGTTHTAEFTFR